MIKDSNCLLERASTVICGRLQYCATRWNTNFRALHARADFRFHACRLDFGTAIRDLSGEKLALSGDPDLSLQFPRRSARHLSGLVNYSVPASIKAIDVRLTEDMTEGWINALECQFQIVYTMNKKASGVPAITCRQVIETDCLLGAWGIRFMRGLAW